MDIPSFLWGIGAGFCITMVRVEGRRFVENN